MTLLNDIEQWEKSKKSVKTEASLVKQNSLLSDIEAFEQSQGKITPKSELQKKPGFLESLFSPITRTVASGVRAGQGALGLGQAGLQALTGNTKGASQTIFDTSEKVQTPFMGQKAVSTPAQSIGTALETASFFVPGGAPLKGLSLGQKILKGAKAGTAIGGLSGAGRSTYEGESIENIGAQTATGALSGGVLGGILPVVSKALSNATNSMGKFASEVVGITTGAQGKSIKEAFNNPNVIKLARQAGADMGGYVDDLAKDVRSALSLVAKKRSDDYVSQLAKIKINPIQLDDVVQSTRQVANQVMKDFDIVANKTVSESGKKLNVLNFDKSNLVEGSNVVEKALNDVLRWTDVSAEGLDTLKRRLQSYANQLTAPGKKEAKNIVEKLKHSVKSGLVDKVPGYEKMTKGYESASNFIDDITRTFSLKDPKSKETSIKRLMASLRENNETRKDLLEALSQSSGDDFVARIAGGQLGQLAPRGLSSKVAQGGATVFALFNPAQWPVLLTYAALASPRAVAEITNILGRVTNDMIKQGRYTPEITNAIKNVFIKALSDENFNKINKN